jgi:Co/Zn/Cd efflux system component
MDASCCDHRHPSDPHRGNPAYRRVLWAVLAINALMFVVEIGAGLAAASASLQAALYWPRFADRSWSYRRQRWR